MLIAIFFNTSFKFIIIFHAIFITPSTWYCYYATCTLSLTFCIWNYIKIINGLVQNLWFNNLCFKLFCDWNWSEIVRILESKMRYIDFCFARNVSFGVEFWFDILTVEEVLYLICKFSGGLLSKLLFYLCSVLSFLLKIEKVSQFFSSNPLNGGGSTLFPSICHRFRQRNPPSNRIKIVHQIQNFNSSNTNCIFPLFFLN